MPRCEVAQRLEEARLRRDHAHVGGDGLDDDGGDFPAMRFEQFFNRSSIVVGSVERQLGERLRHAGARSDSQRGEARARLREKAVGVAVVAAFEFYDEVAAGGGAREPHGAHGGFGARTDETNLFAGRNGLADARGKLHFELGGHAVARAAARLLGDGFDDARMRVAQDQRAPRTDVIDVFVSVRVPQPRAGGAIDDDGIAAHSAKGAHRAIHAADQHIGRAAKDFLRARPLHLFQFR